jgi:hypothetical protein
MKIGRSPTRKRFAAYARRCDWWLHRHEIVEKEDTPRPLLFQLDLLREVGFTLVDVLHKNVCFAAFGVVKGS